VCVGVCVLNSKCLSVGVCVSLRNEGVLTYLYLYLYEDMSGYVSLSTCAFVCVRVIVSIWLCGVPSSRKLKK
jgi:hypothetical protein